MTGRKQNKKSTPKGKGKAIQANRKQFTTRTCELCDELDVEEMVCCDLCSKWYHFSCVNITSIREEDEWVCQQCKDEISKSSAQLVFANPESPTTVSKSQPSQPTIVVSTSQTVTSHEMDQLSLSASVSTRVSSVIQQPNYSGYTGHDYRIFGTNHQSFDENPVVIHRYVQEGYPRMTASSSQPFNVPYGFDNIQRYSNYQGIQTSNVRFITPSPYRQQFTRPNVQNQPIQMNQIRVNEYRMDNPTSSQHQQSEQVNTINNESTRIVNNVPSNQPSEASNRMANRQRSDTISKTSTKRSIVSSRRQAIELDMIEEERELREKRDKEYLDQKYRILMDECEEDESPTVIDRNGYTKDWISKLSRDAREENKFVPSQQVIATAPDWQLILSKAQIAARHVVTKDLPIFYGQPEEWPIFISRYNNSTKTCGFSNQENLDRLQKCLKGNALESVRSRLLSADSVPSIIETLRMLYGRPDLIINSLIRNIRQEPAPKADKLNTLVDFAMKVGNLSSIMEQTGLKSHLANPIVLQELVEKLPTNIKIEWARHKQHLVIVDLAVFGEWLYRLAETISIVTEPTITKPPDKKSENKPESKWNKGANNQNTHQESQLINAHTEKDQVTTKPSNCLICAKQCQKTEDCSVFRSYDVNRRWKELKDKNLCRKCLGRHGRFCFQNNNCGIDGCFYKHHALLHDKVKHAITTPAAETNPIVKSNHTHGTFNRKVLLRIIPVTLHAGDRTVKTFAYLDDGSDLTMANRNLIARLGIKGSLEPLCLLWTGEVHRKETNSQRVTFRISGPNYSNQYVLRDVRTVEALGLPKQTLIKNELMKRFPYLQEAPIEDYINATPEILIGSDNVSLIAQTEIIEGNFNQPIATKTRLGWSIHGNTDDRHSGISQASINPHNSICPYNSVDYDEIHQQIKEFFTLENLGVQANYTLSSKDDEKALELLKKYTKRVDGGFETALLWRYDTVHLPESYGMALKRLNCLEKHKPEMIEVINQTIMDYCTKGYASKLDSQEILKVQPKTWYLPIFAVKYPKKPDKIRTVFDAAATTKGVSLNSMLLRGPDQLASLTDILRRFREKKFAITGDIKEMFHQVRIRNEDKQAQRFLWRNGDKSKEPDQYVMNVMTFGAKCSPSAAQYVKDLNAATFAVEFPRAVEAITKNHYVDDWLDGDDDEDKLMNLTNEVISIHKQGGFEIRNFLSNSINVRKALGKQPDEGKNLNLELDLGTERVLGMWWKISSDTFTFSLKYTKIDKEIVDGTRSPTKREVLKILMSIFDPLGFLSHYLIHLKILLQEVWRSKMDWDEQLNTNDMKIAWTRWFELLNKVEDVEIPRLLSTKISPNVAKSTELHIFVDASEQAFSAVAYLRVEDDAGVECSLIGSKARVAPLKYLSIPRMELQAGILGTRMLTSICNGQTIRIDRRRIWTDSTTLLSWIRSDHRKYHQFVANRIGEIIENTNINEWRWIPSKENVADDATKWEKVPAFHQEDRWFSGPSFLYLPPAEWPKQKSHIEPDDPEEMKVHLAHSHLAVPALIVTKNFSTWIRMHRTMAYVLRYTRNLRAKIRKQVPTKGPLTQEELFVSEKIIFRQAQYEEFTEEVIILKRNQELSTNKKLFIKASSTIYKCSPYLDEYGVIRIRGRIDMAYGIPYDTKRPIILPKNHRITRLLVEDYHHQYHHRNNRTVYNEIRQKFFVPHLRVVVNSVRKNCQRCKNRYAQPIVPEMADLPEARLAVGFRAFTYIGIDYFGPLYVAFGRQRLKRWGMLITCLTVRAVHIEIVYSMDTDSCIMGLRNHININGKAEEIFSDNGTNFKGLDNELKRLIQNIDLERMATEFTNCYTKWNFNPPESKHMGGVWEIMVKSVKRCLYEILPERNPTDDALRNLIVEVVNVVNSRPLTYIPLNHENDEILTPNHFIKGSSNGLKPMIDIDASGPILRSKWMENQRLLDLFWTKFVEEYLPDLTRRSKWHTPAEPIKIGDIVLIIDEENVRNTYPKAKVVETLTGSNGQVRRVRVQRADKAILWRSASGLAKLDIRNDETIGLPVEPVDIQTSGSVTNDNTARRK